MDREENALVLGADDLIGDKPVEGRHPHDRGIDDLTRLDGDGRPELVTAPGAGMESEIGVFSQHWVNGQDRGTRLAHFDAFEPSFSGGAAVATGDVNGDGTPDVVAASGPGRPGEVRIFDSSGRQLLSFLPFGSDYTGGLSVAAGDLNADGRAEIVVGTLAAPARIRAFVGNDPYGPVISPFAPGDSGVEVAVADVAGTGRGLIVAGDSDRSISHKKPPPRCSRSFLDKDCGGL